MCSGVIVLVLLVLVFFFFFAVVLVVVASCCIFCFWSLECNKFLIHYISFDTNIQQWRIQWRMRVESSA